MMVAADGVEVARITQNSLGMLLSPFPVMQVVIFGQSKSSGVVTELVGNSRRH